MARQDRRRIAGSVRAGLCVLCASLLFAAIAVFTGSAAHAQGRGEEAIARLVMAPIQLGAKDPNLPVWRVLDGGNAPIGWAFETIELAPIPGFSGTPVNLFVMIDDAGTFMKVSVLDHNEPVFVSGLGPQPLNEFVRQYEGRSLASAFKIGKAEGKSADASSTAVILDGVAKATASVNIVNDTLLGASLKVAREKLSGVAPRPTALPIADRFEEMTFDELVAAGLVGHRTITGADIAKAFPTYSPEGTDRLFDDDVYMEIWVADLGIPTVGLNLFAEDGLERAVSRNWEHEEPILILVKGNGTVRGPDFVPRATPDRVSMSQGEFAVSIRDSDASIEPKAGVSGFDEAMILRADRRLGFNPGDPWTLNVRLAAQKNILEAPVTADFPITVSAPADYFETPVAEDTRPAWVAAWEDRAVEIGVLLAFVGVVVAALAMQRRIANPPRLLDGFRLGALAVTLGFIGWYGQGQLSVVNILVVLKGLIEGTGLSVMLYDPFSTLIWPVTIVALLVWGRGTFCGWFCPFGALQEFASRIGRALGIRVITVPARLDHSLKYVKYGVLVLIIGGAFSGTAFGEKLVELEPFKTAITVGFDREWTYVAYAAGLILLSPFVFKAYCRYLCPLGAFLAITGRVRMLNWIPRRAECGTPCRLCEKRCQYQAIERSGKIDYAECFQCLDCVSIHDDVSTCVPLVIERKRTRRAGSGQPGVTVKPRRENAVSA